MGMPSRLQSRVLLIGWDAADWKLLQPLMEAGALPHVSGLVERGVMGKMATMPPPLSPLLWTTVATGVTPDLHGILGFLEPDEATGGVRPVSSGSRKVKALWNMLHHRERRSVVVNWFASHPAEPIRGAMVSDAFAKSGAARPVPHGSVHPRELTGELARLRIGPEHLSGPDLALFIPGLKGINLGRDSRPAALAGFLAENITAHAAATWLMEHEDWDFFAVFYDLIDHAGHLFMPFHPPAVDTRSPGDAEAYKDVMAGVCRYLDAMLGRLLQLAGPETTVVLLSDHGMHTDHLRPRANARYKVETPALMHRSHGIFCMAGPGVRRDELIHGVELVDVAPTLLGVLGLPVGEDMPGRVLAEAFEQPPKPNFIASWEKVEGDSGRTMAAEDDAWDSAQAMLQLAELGYIDPPGEASVTANQKLRQAVQNHNDFNLARVYLSQHRPAEALALLERLVREAPEELAYQLHLAQCYYELGRREDCRARAEAVMQADGDRPAAGLILANLHIAEGRLEEGLALLARAQQGRWPSPAIRCQIGAVYAQQQRWEEAAAAFEAVLDLDRDFAPAWSGLARARLAQRRHGEAADAALEAVCLQFSLAEAHATLGMALAALGVRQRAAQAFATCLALRPGMAQAQAGLAALQRADDIAGRAPGD